MRRVGSHSHLPGDCRQMRLIRAISAYSLELFADDWPFACAILAWLGVTCAVLPWAGVPRAALAVPMLLGLIGLLVAGAVRQAWTRSRRSLHH